MNYRIGVSTTFKKDIKHLGKRYPSIVDDYAHLLEELEANPNLGTDLGRRLDDAVAAVGLASAFTAVRAHPYAVELVGGGFHVYLQNNQ